jgi:hypothetical protein
MHSTKTIAGKIVAYAMARDCAARNAANPNTVGGHRGIDPTRVIATTTSETGPLSLDLINIEFSFGWRSAAAARAVSARSQRP